MSKERRLFLDYGELIFNYNFNKDTLSRAHKLALSYINSLNGHQISPRTLGGAHNKAIQVYLTARKRDNSEWKMSKIMSLMLENLGINADVSELEDIYKLNDHDSRPFPNMNATLQQLSKNHKLGIISNLPHDSLITELGNYDMLDMFDTITISCQVGYRKPHPAIYNEAMNRANTKPENSIFVSHDEEEVEGANNVGMRGILVKSLEEVIGQLWAGK